MHEDYYFVKLLLKRGANPNIYHYFQRTPLIVAAENHKYPNNVKIIKILLKYGADKTKKNTLGQTALNIAIYNGNCASVIKLLS